MLYWGNIRNCVPKKEGGLTMTVLEQRFMETFPNIMRDVAEQLKGIKEELKKYNENINRGTIVDSNK
jgi:hypothetical protein